MTDVPVRVRFAPSPTGYLHLGNARTALFNWLFARHHGGTYILRVEDTDAERSTDAMLAAVLEALGWLGMDWDEGPGKEGAFGPYRQSERAAIYREQVDRLLAEGRAYHCYMSPEELDALREQARAANETFRYRGFHRALSAGQIAAYEAEGRQPVVRLKVDASDPWTVEDLVKGTTTFPADFVDDFILMRSDGSPSFHLANVVDDALMQVTHVIRGEDHLPNTAKHLALYAALGFAPPRFAHLPMILGADRSKLSKRHGGVDVMAYAREGYLPEAMNNMLALLGWSPEDEKEILDAGELIERFGLERCGKSGSIFDFDKLRHLNAVRLRAMALEDLMPLLGEDLAPFVERFGEEGTRQIVAMVQKDFELTRDLPRLGALFLSEPVYDAETLAAMRAEEAMAAAGEVAAAALEAYEACTDPWTPETIKALHQPLGKALGVKGKGLFFPLRAALTGQFHGPDLVGFVAIQGQPRCLTRLRNFLECWEG